MYYTRWACSCDVCWLGLREIVLEWKWSFRCSAPLDTPSSEKQNSVGNLGCYSMICKCLSPFPVLNLRSLLSIQIIPEHTSSWTYSPNLRSFYRSRLYLSIPAQYLSIPAHGPTLPVHLFTFTIKWLAANPSIFIFPYFPFLACCASYDPVLFNVLHVMFHATPTHPADDSESCAENLLVPWWYTPHSCATTYVVDRHLTDRDPALYSNMCSVGSYDLLTIAAGKFPYVLCSTSTVNLSFRFMLPFGRF